MEENTKPRELSTSASSSLDLALLIGAKHYNPHQFLGLHKLNSGQVIRLWRPGAEKIHLEVKGKIVEAVRTSEYGLFEYFPTEEIFPSDYRVYHQNGLLARDPYSFLPTIGELDLHLFSQGCHYELYSALGANIKTIDGVSGVSFTLWAPNATHVALIADFNHFNGKVCPMRSMGHSGIWELFVPGLSSGEKYKFEIRTKEGYIRTKSDPYAVYSELRPKTASVVYDLNNYRWKSKRKNKQEPMNIYEVHLGSWKNYGVEFPNYRQLAPDLAAHCKELGFTHVELLPVMEHPLDESWGYQVTGFFSVTSRYGTPSDFQYFVDYLHEAGIGVILDWVPAHFPTDDYSLNRFDGTALYEHEDPRKGMHPHWQTAIFNYGRKEISNFLIASALFWLDKMQVDGLRVDAVASMLYLDYGRKHGEWIPNLDGSNFNIDAIELIKHLNSIIHQKFPDAVIIAEESSSFSGVTHKEGLVFDLKWNMGLMNDTLRYFSRDCYFRRYHQNELTFSLLYAFTEKFMCVLSHDEVVHGKGSLLSKMPGDEWQKFANLRLLYSYMMCHPGRKLFFMGTELAQYKEWNCKEHLDWHLLKYDLHLGMYEMVKELNHFYLSCPALWEYDFDWQGFEWVDFSDFSNSVIAYFRKSKDSVFLCVHHFTPEYRPNYLLPLKNVKSLKEVFNSDAVRFGGSGKHNQEQKLSIDLSPLATMIFEVEFV
jgi:1,4-alpha-glucan branching enzyme